MSFAPIAAAVTSRLVRSSSFLTIVFCLTVWFASGLSAAPLTRPAIWSSTSQTWFGYEDLVKNLRRTDLVFLGELHDNPEHHKHRARLLGDLNRANLHVVFEQLPSQESFVIPRAENSLLQHLQLKGFNDRAWEWPLHEPLFAAAQRIGLPVTGGNLLPGLGRRFLSDGSNAVPEGIKAVLEQAPLSAAALADLDAALIEGHCGHLPKSMLPIMRLVQQSTDISMVINALTSLPAVVIAGNGHVQKNFGMPHYANHLLRTRNVIAVGFLESPPLKAAVAESRSGTLSAVEIPAIGDQQLFDFIWVTTRIDREDPCKTPINFNHR